MLDAHLFAQQGHQCDWQTPNKVEELIASKNDDDYIMWWVGDFHAMCCDSHKDNVKRVMLDGSGQFNGITITATVTQKILRLGIWI